MAGNDTTGREPLSNRFTLRPYEACGDPASDAPAPARVAVPAESVMVAAWVASVP